MMKRIVCFAAALLMLLTTTAGAESAYQATLTWEADAEGAKAYLEQTTDLEGARLESAAQGYADLANGLEVQLNLQETGGYMAVSLMDTLLVDMGAYGNEYEAYVLSNLLPGYYVDASLSNEEVLAVEAAIEQLTQTDLESVLNGMPSVFAEWIGKIPATAEQGNFIGDTYEGGAVRLTYTFDDRDLAALLDGVIACLAEGGLTDELLDTVLGDVGFIAALRSKNQTVAAENRYSYVLHNVNDAYGVYIGSSLLVLEDGQQVMTVSFAVADNGVRLVWGYGMNEMNYFIDAVLIDDGTTEDTTALAYSLTVYQDPYREGFRAVEPYIDYVAMMYSGVAQVREKDGETSWVIDVESMIPNAATSETRYLIDGSYMHEAETIDQTMKWYLSKDDETPSITTRFNLRPCEPMTYDLEGLTAIDPEAAESSELVDSLVEDAVSDLVVKLFKLVPAQVLTTLMN